MTGAARGIGLDTAHIFAEDPHNKVIGLDRNWGGSELSSEIERLHFDLREIEAIPDLIKDIGRVDVLINNAGCLHCPSPDGNLNPNPINPNPNPMKP